MRKGRVGLVLLAGAFIFILCGAGHAAVWGTSELDTEKLAVKFAGEVIKGGYKIVTTDELKAWVEKKEPMLVVDTMPLEDSYVKNHIPGAVQFELPVDEMPQMDDKTKAAFEKTARSGQSAKVGLLLWVHQVRPKPQRGHVCREDGLYQRLSPPGGDQRLAGSGR